jgi:hypothetical protein
MCSDDHSDGYYEWIEEEQEKINRLINDNILNMQNKIGQVCTECNKIRKNTDGMVHDSYCNNCHMAYCSHKFKKADNGRYISKTIGVKNPGCCICGNNINIRSYTVLPGIICLSEYNAESQPLKPLNQNLLFCPQHNYQKIIQYVDLESPEVQNWMCYRRMMYLALGLNCESQVLTTLVWACDALLYNYY